MLLDYDLPGLTFEALVLKHPAQFYESVRDAARWRLEGAGIQIGDLSQPD
jgi:hypothetical protein